MHIFFLAVRELEHIVERAGGPGFFLSPSWSPTIIFTPSPPTIDPLLHSSIQHQASNMSTAIESTSINCSKGPARPPSADDQLQELLRRLEESNREAVRLALEDTEESYVKLNSNTAASKLLLNQITALRKRKSACVPGASFHASASTFLSVAPAPGVRPTATSTERVAAAPFSAALAHVTKMSGAAASHQTAMPMATEPKTNGPLARPAVNLAVCASSTSPPNCSTVAVAAPQAESPEAAAPGPRAVPMATASTTNGSRTPPAVVPLLNLKASAPIMVPPDRSSVAIVASQTHSSGAAAPHSLVVLKPSASEIENKNCRAALTHAQPSQASGAAAPDPLATSKLTASTLETKSPLKPLAVISCNLPERSASSRSPLARSSVATAASHAELQGAAAPQSPATSKSMASVLKYKGSPAAPVANPRSMLGADAPSVRSSAADAAARAHSHAAVVLPDHSTAAAAPYTKLSTSSTIRIRMSSSRTSLDADDEPPANKRLRRLQRQLDLPATSVIAIDPGPRSRRRDPTS